uniref:DOC domain-containing protein n=1 Tax=Leptobrachium leishanense TaxID=445787 RepID=A0A8C5QL11_9ANUR
MSVGERRNGNLLVQLGPKLQAQPEELLRQRWSPEGHAEYLIRWAVQSLEEAAGANAATSLTENKSTSILMWMSAEEVYSNCPTLLGKRKPEGSGVPEEKTSRAPDDGALREMREDVRMLVQRATRQMSQSSGPDASILNTIHVLSAYASIGSLAGVFKETGALDLLMKMLCNQEKQIRKNAGKMLRALASHDAGSRAHVLLSLSQQDGIEQHMDFEARYTLLQLFAETASSEEHCISFEGIHLPQIPGKQLFSLVKRYLCVTSLLDQLSTNQPDYGEKNRLQRQFDFSMAMGSLICELVRVMGWVSERPSESQPPSAHYHPRVLRSIFQPKVPACANLTVSVMAPLRPSMPKKQPGKPFMSPSDFPSRNGYVDYIQEALKPGMTVRMLEDYEEVSSGDEGVFRQSNNGMPPVQVLWRSTGRTYWVHWHMLEITGSGNQAAEEDNQDKASRVLGRVSGARGRRVAGACVRGSPQDPATLRRDEWWELLFFIRRLEPQEHQDVYELLRQNQDGEVNLDEPALAHLSVSQDSAHKVLQVLAERCCGSVLTDLQNSHVYAKYLTCVRDGETQSPNSKTTSAETSQGAFASKKPKTEGSPKVENLGAPPESELSDLQLLNNLLLLEGLNTVELTEKTQGTAPVWRCCAWSRAIEAPPPPIIACSLYPTGFSTFKGHTLGPSLEMLVEIVGPVRVILFFPLQLLQEMVTFLHRLASSNKDCAVVMCRLGAKETLSKVLEKQSATILLAPELRDLLTDSEKYASLYQKMATSILAGCIQMVLGQIEEHRRSQQQINIPFFDVFLRNLCQGSSVEVKEDKCWEKIEVSSNSYRANKLTDGNPKSYWESTGATGSHYVNIYMHRGVIVRQLFITVALEDSSYMPARIVVMGGESPSSINTELNAVNIPSTAGRVLLLENLARFWPIVQIKIKRCQQGGIDTRVRGIEILGPKPTFWPVFKEQLCRRTFLFYTSRAHSWGQEICEKRETLLQLFGRLNRALSHEQVFAEHFLPDDEAAQAVGRTCWEALISPLVQSITTPGTAYNGTAHIHITRPLPDTYHTDITRPLPDANHTDITHITRPSLTQIRYNPTPPRHKSDITRPLPDTNHRYNPTPSPTQITDITRPSLTQITDITRPLLDTNQI